MIQDNEGGLPQDDIDVEIVDVQEVSAVPGRRPSGSVCSFGIPERDDLKVYVSQTVLAGMLAHLRSDTSRELGGILLGQLHEDSGDHYLDISDFLPAEHTESSGLHLRFTLKTWEATDRERERRYPNGDKIVVGWYHSHPGLGVFVSSHDQQVHKQFHSWWQVAIVVDPKKLEFGCFRARGDWLLMCSGLYLYGENETVRSGEITYAAAQPIRQFVARQQEPSGGGLSQTVVHRAEETDGSPVPFRAINKLVLLAVLIVGCAGGFLLGASLAGPIATLPPATVAARELTPDIAAELLSATDATNDQHPVSQSDVLLGVLCIGGDQTAANEADSRLRASLWSRRFRITSLIFTNFVSEPEQHPNASVALDDSTRRLLALSQGDGKRVAVARYLRDCFRARQDLLDLQPFEVEFAPLAAALSDLTNLWRHVSNLGAARLSLEAALQESDLAGEAERQVLMKTIKDDLYVKATTETAKDFLLIVLERVCDADDLDSLWAALPTDKYIEAHSQILELLELAQPVEKTDATSREASQ